MLHIAKLAVGVRDIDHIRALQAERLRSNPPLRHRTRNFPRRGQEVLDGGSLYWVISGSMLARQRIVDIVEDKRDGGEKCAALHAGPGGGAADRAADAAVPGVALSGGGGGSGGSGSGGDGGGGGDAAAGAAAGVTGVVFDLGGRPSDLLLV